jgi:mannose-6-phosphate isomerase class I
MARVVEPKTRIGSPYVIAGMETARSKGRRVVCGWEANGGFLTGSDIHRNGRILTALPTRDAVLPILCVLFAAHDSGLPLAELFARLPRRFSRASLLKRFPRPTGLKVVNRFSPAAGEVRAVVFRESGTVLLDEGENELPLSNVQEVEVIRNRLGEFFTPEMGFGPISRLNYIDGVRVIFSNGDVAHLRPSGNADELRIYAVADTQARADTIAEMGVAEPDGILRRMERAVMAECLRDARRTKSGILPLKGVVKHYEWGGHHFIPGLLKLENERRKPFAELWIGAHPNAPSTTEVEGLTVPLDKLLQAAPEAILGPAAASRFAGRLPYLLKVLDARTMLSIQAHPTKLQAEEGFARENAAAISLEAAHRSYKDDNHKPEVQVAINEVWMLHGFRPLEEIAETFRAVREMTPIMADFTARLARVGQDAGARRELLRELYGALMTMPQGRVDAVLDPLIARLKGQERLDKHCPDYWARRAAEDFSRRHGHRDRGILSIYLLNLVHLRPGQGTFQPPGVLHAYLEGVNVELMANSDNVLRGGLTPKHVDVEELMRALSFDSSAPHIFDGDQISPTEKVYRTPALEFELSRVEVDAGSTHTRRTAYGPDSLIVLAGSVTMKSAGHTFPLDRGDAVLVPHGVNYVIEAGAVHGRLFKASVPETAVLGSYRKRQRTVGLAVNDSPAIIN